jgi:hypothetical protein
MCRQMAAMARNEALIVVLAGMLIFAMALFRYFRGRSLQRNKADQK